MPTFYAPTNVQRFQNPPDLTAGDVNGGSLKSIGVTVDLAAVPRANGTTGNILNGDDLFIGTLPAGCTPVAGFINSTVALGGTATVAVGIPGATGKYRAAAIQNSVGLIWFGIPAVANYTLGAVGDEQVFLTVAAANLPTSGILQVELLYKQQT